MQIGETINTVYGPAKLEKINRTTVVVIIQGPRRMKLTRKQVEIMNPA